MDSGAVLSFVQGVLLLALVFLAALTDLRNREILNLPSLLAIVSGLLLGWLRGGWGELSLDLREQVSLFHAAAGMLIFAGPLFLAYLARGMGAGDVKLAAGVGALGGLNFAAWTLVHTAFAGAVLALVVLVWRGELRSVSRRFLRGMIRWRWKEEAEAGKPVPLPYAVAITIGTLWTIVSYIGQTPLPFF